MITGLFIAAVLIGAYLAAGWRIALAQLPRSWAIARKAWCTEDNQRGSVRMQTVGIVLIWPLVLAIPWYPGCT